MQDNDAHIARAEYKKFRNQVLRENGIKETAPNSVEIENDSSK